MTREALTAELQALESRKAEIEQQLADLDAGLLRERDDDPVAYRMQEAYRIEAGPSGVRGAPWKVEPLFSIPATLGEESHSE